MKTTATGKLTIAYLKKLSRYNFFATAFAIFIATLSLLWMLFHIGGDKDTVLFADYIYALAAIIGGVWACQTAYRTRYGAVQTEPRLQLAWLLMGTGMVINSIGGFYYGYLEYIGQPPFPSLADVFFNLFYPFTFIGLLLIPTTFRFRMRTALDALIAALCLLGVSWFFVIGPLYFANVRQATTFPAVLTLITSLSYPCEDLVILLALLLLIQRGIEPVLRFALLLFGVGFLFETWADAAYAYTNGIFHMYQTGTPYIDPFWIMAYLLQGLAGLYMYTAIVRRTYTARIKQGEAAPYVEEAAYIPSETSLNAWQRFQSLLVYIPLTLMLGLMVYGEATHDDAIADSLTMLTALTGTLVATRYFLATRENEKLLRERERRRQESDRLHHIMTQLAQALDIDYLRERIVSMAISELGFDSAMLLLVEDLDHPHNHLPHLLVTATSISTNTVSWRLQGDNALYRTYLLGKECELDWQAHQFDLPTEIQTWQQGYHIPVMVFFPLSYQGKLLGSLGVSRRSAPPLCPYDISVMRAYTEQATALIEHAHLYQEAHEHETFARAMINIATRLNAAVVEPAEISQLICEEAATALRADYVLFYVSGGNGQLMPLATYIADPEPGASPQDWPTIYPYEYEAQTVNSLQPVILYVQQPQVTGPLSMPDLVTPAMALSAPTQSMYPVPVGSRELRRYRAPTLREHLARHYVHTAILAPLVARGDPVGLLIFARAHHAGAGDRRAFDQSDLSQAQDFAEQAGVAFTNAQLYQRVRADHKRLQELDQLKDQFMTTASHELRTPLTAVQGYIELMAQYGDALPPDQRNEFLQKARRGCEELVVLLGNVMDASRLEVEAGIKPALMQRVSVREMIDNVILLIEPHLTQEQREVRMQIPSNLHVYADPVRLRQVLMNISTNALKYSPVGTSIGFSARASLDRSPYVIISVSDKGKGIRPQDQKLLFQRFVRLESDINSPVRGSGLGLYISRRLVEAMGGKIWIESRGVAGEGSTFHIQLPIAY
jgi:signal transduction histidine kinase